MRAAGRSLVGHHQVLHCQIVASAWKLEDHSGTVLRRCGNVQVWCTHDKRAWHERSGPACIGAGGAARRQVPRTGLEPVTAGLGNPLQCARR